VTFLDMQRFLIWLGLVILLTGVMWPILSRIGLGRLPGDFMFQRDGTTFYFPVITCITISIVLSALFWLFNPITNKDFRRSAIGFNPPERAAGRRFRLGLFLICTSIKCANSNRAQPLSCT